MTTPVSATTPTASLPSESIRSEMSAASEKSSRCAHRNLNGKRCFVNSHSSVIVACRICEKTFCVSHVNRVAHQCDLAKLRAATLSDLVDSKKPAELRVILRDGRRMY